MLVMSIWTVFGVGIAVANIAFVFCCLQLLINGNCCAKLRLRREAGYENPIQVDTHSMNHRTGIRPLRITPSAL